MVALTASKPIALEPRGDGVFVGDLGRRRRYRLSATDGTRRWEFEDPYRFGPVLGALDLHLIAETPGRTRLELWQGDFLGLPHAARRAREAGRQWVERLVGVKRVAEELSRAQAA